MHLQPSYKYQILACIHLINSSLSNSKLDKVYTYPLSVQYNKLELEARKHLYNITYKLWMLVTRTGAKIFIHSYML